MQYPAVFQFRLTPAIKQALRLSAEKTNRSMGRHIRQLICEDAKARGLWPAEDDQATERINDDV